MPRVLRTGAIARFTRCSRPLVSSTPLKPSLLSRVEPEAGPSTLTRTEQSTPRLASILLRKSSQSSTPEHIRSSLTSTAKPVSLLSSALLRFPTFLPSISASTSTTIQQIRSVTYGSEYQPSQRVRKRRHGFLARRRSKSGRKVLIRRRMKGRRFLSH